MKNLLLLAFFMAFGLSGMMAQKSCSKAAGTADKASCAKKCTSAKTASVDAKGTAVLSMAEEMAAKNENIEKRTCSASGTVSYYEKSVCSTSGHVSFNEVTFDDETQTFVNVSPKEHMKGDMDVKMTKTAEMAPSESAAKPACCASGKKTTACCSKKGKAAHKKEGM